MSAPDVMVYKVRVGVFSDLHHADQAVSRLMAAGFTADQITVTCAGEAKENFMQKYTGAAPETEARGEVTTGAAIGATVGGLSAITLGAISGFVPLVIAGVSGLAAGGAMGGFLGAMTSKGVENDFVNTYHEQLLQGKILVAVEAQDQDDEARLAEASRILQQEGSELNMLPQP